MGSTPIRVAKMTEIINFNDLVSVKIPSGDEIMHRLIVFLSQSCLTSKHQRASDGILEESVSIREEIIRHWRKKRKLYLAHLDRDGYAYYEFYDWEDAIEFRSVFLPKEYQRAKIVIDTLP